MTYRGVCEFCGTEVKTYESAAYRIRGWEVERKPGASQVIGKERQQNRICHARCVEAHVRRERLGLRGQTTL